MTPLPLVFVLLFSTVTLPCEEEARRLESRARQGGSPELLRAASRLVSECPGNARARNLLATLLEDSGDSSGAARQYQEAHRLDPKWAYPLLGLGDLSASRKENEKAREYFLEAARLASNAEERNQAARALEGLPGTPRSYGFKSAASIERLLDVGRDHRGRRGAAVRLPNPSLDTYVSETGIALNFSIEFDFDSAAIRPGSVPQLVELASALKKASPAERYFIEGHTSSEGDPGHNTRLSLERARSVVAYLVAAGVRTDLLAPRGLGFSQPVIENGIENREKSRRVTVFRPF